MSTDVQIIDTVRAPRGRLYVEAWQRGRLIDVLSDDNLIVIGMRNVQSHLLGGTVSNNSVTQIGFGTDGTAPANGNSGLTGAFIKNVDSASYPSIGVVQFAFTLLTTDAVGLAISEFGLFTTAGTLVARRIRPAPLHKTSSISLTGNWQISF